MAGLSLTCYILADILQEQMNPCVAQPGSASAVHCEAFWESLLWKVRMQHCLAEPVQEQVHCACSTAW